MKIYINDLTFETIVGVLKIERITPQKVIIDVECEYNYNTKYLNYAEIIKLIQNRMIEQKYEILEVALIDLTRLLKENFKNITSLKIKIIKPDIIKNAKVAVEYEI